MGLGLYIRYKDNLGSTINLSLGCVKNMMFASHPLLVIQPVCPGEVKPLNLQLIKVYILPSARINVAVHELVVC